MGNIMKKLTITALIAALVAIPFMLKSKKGKLPPIYTDENKRYDINDYIEEMSL
jgi:hypothetical protein